MKKTKRFVLLVLAVVVLLLAAYAGKTVLDLKNSAATEVRSIAAISSIARNLRILLYLSIYRISIYSINPHIESVNPPFLKITLFSFKHFHQSLPAQLTFSPPLG